MAGEVLKIETPSDFVRAVARAAELLQRGEIVAVPTETVYGLAANAFNETAVRRIYEVKERPSANPIIVHIASIAMAKKCAAVWPETANVLARAFWPGPLTVVLPKAAAIPVIVTAGGETVGIRWPAHPFMQELIRRCDFPLAAPSANLANALSPTSASHVLKMLGAKIPLVVDAGPSNIGIESTVVDLSVDPPRILRAGMISASEVGSVIGRTISEKKNESGTLKSPGQLAKHYSPKATLVIRKWRDDAELGTLISSFTIAPAKISVISHERIPHGIPFGRVAIIPHDPEAYARALYAELHHCDQVGATLILVEEVPSGDEWAGIRDRLQRASAPG
jgi:L-threonylcarbamoyladenylate synthase